MSNLKLQGELSLDGSGWERTLRTAGNSASHFAKDGLGEIKNAIAGAFTFGVIEEFTRSIIESSVQIKELSEQTGTTTDEVQKLGYAARDVGLTFEDVAGSLSRMGAARKDAAEGNLELRDTFARYGVTLEDLQDPEKRNIDLLNQTAKAIEGVELSAGKRQELRELFGKGGDKLAAVMAALKNAEGVHIIAPGEIEQIDQADKKLGKLLQQIKANAAQPIAGGAGILNGLDDAIKNKSIAGKPMMDILMGWMQMGVSLSPGSMGNINPSKAVGDAQAAVAREAGAATHTHPAAMFEDKIAVKEAADLLEEQYKLAQAIAKRKFDGLGASQKEVALQKEITAELRAAEEIERRNGGSQTASSVDIRLRANSKQSELDQLLRGGGGSFKTDSFLGHGNFLGHTTREIPAIQERLIDAHKQSLNALERNTQALLASRRNGDGFSFGLP